MTKLDPIIAVRNVEASSAWYQKVFECQSLHGGSEFDVLVDKKGEVLLCLHKWGEHDHPSLTKPGTQTGNGLILYFRTENMAAARQNISEMNHAIEKEIAWNENSRHQEFSVKDLDGYYVTISDYHSFRG